MGLTVQEIACYTKGFKLPSVEEDYVDLLKVLRHEKDIRLVVWGDDVGGLGC